MKRAILIFAGLLIATAALAQLAGTGTNTGPSFNKWDKTGMGIINNFTTNSTPPPPDCASPTAPDGTVDFSQCSNAFYIAVIL